MDGWLICCGPCQQRFALTCCCSVGYLRWVIMLTSRACCTGYLRRAQLPSLVPAPWQPSSSLVALLALPSLPPALPTPTPSPTPPQPVPPPSPTTSPLVTPTHPPSLYLTALLVVMQLIGWTVGAVGTGWTGLDVGSRCVQVTHHHICAFPLPFNPLPTLLCPAFCPSLRCP